VLLNLITNACQAMAETGGVLTIATAPHDDAIRIEVADTGPGVAPHVRNRIFDPFFTTKPVGKGTGLGLSVAHGIMRAHGGGIWLDESATDGARFVLELPPRTAPEPQSGRAETPLPSEHKILVVDDEPEIAEVLGALLEQLGATVVIALSAREARACLAEATFDLVTLDLVMPEESGADLWRTLAREQPEVAARVVFVTGNIDPAMQRFVDGTGRPDARQTVHARGAQERRQFGGGLDGPLRILPLEPDCAGEARARRNPISWGSRECGGSRRSRPG
jgi:CheY-like chemotaxis protein